MKKTTSKKISKVASKERKPAKAAKTKKKNSPEAGNSGTIGGDLEAFLKEHVIYETMDNEKLKFAKTEISKIIKRYFPTRKYQTFVQVFRFENEFHALIGFRRLDENKFSYINCGIGPNGFER
jgi:hypothetical protein